jgi:hypothetical protein
VDKNVTTSPAPLIFYGYFQGVNYIFLSGEPIMKNLSSGFARQHSEHVDSSVS